MGHPERVVAVLVEDRRTGFEVELTDDSGEVGGLIGVRESRARRPDCLCAQGLDEADVMHQTSETQDVELEHRHVAPP